MRRRLCTYSVLLAVGLCSIAFTSQASAAGRLNEIIIRDMPVNSWYEVPSSVLVNDCACSKYGYERMGNIGFDATCA